ncbi:MAG: Crp/Fnr family transcriptional regulator [Cyclobacteriaceae bacterium]|nr:Crp/Fnr family transcriptional regulator [Cyclobacteriaceae bacterium]
MNTLIREFKKFGTISTDAELDFHKRVVREERRKGSFYIKEGQTTSGLFIIEKGLVRMFYRKNDKEINSLFAIEDEVVTSSRTFFFELPAKEYIQFLEDSIIYSISRNDLYELCAIYPEINTIERMATEAYSLALEDRIFSLQTLSAVERYEELVRDYPQILQRVSLGHIASYLGVALETISRIRKK